VTGALHSDQFQIRSSDRTTDHGERMRIQIRRVQQRSSCSSHVAAVLQPSSQQAQPAAATHERRTRSRSHARTAARPAGRYAERALTSRTAATTPHHGCLTRAPATRSPRREAARTQHRLARTPQQHICICQSIACVTTAVTHCVCRRRRPRVQVLCTSHKTDLREIGLKMGAHSAPLGFRVR
jgi:hypothetical protein